MPHWDNEDLGGSSSARAARARFQNAMGRQNGANHDQTEIASTQIAVTPRVAEGDLCGSR
jgi:hypothetical protein